MNRLRTIWMKLNGIQGYCRLCNRPIFRIRSPWGERGLCMYCNDAYEEGIDALVSTEELH